MRTICVHMGAAKFVTVFAVCAAFAAQAADFVPEERTGAAIQKAIDAAFAAGGGRVALEKGAVYESVTIRLKSHVELHVPDGTVILGSSNPDGEFLACEDMVVEDCTLNSACQCVRLSCPSDGLIRNGVFRRLKMRGHNGVLSGHPAHYLLKGERGSARMEDILVEDCDIDVDASAILFKVDPEVSLPGFGNVTFRDIRMKSKYALILQGTDKAILRNIRFENVSGTVEAKTPVQVTCVEGLAFDCFSVTSGPARNSNPKSE